MIHEVPMAHANNVNEPYKKLRVLLIGGDDNESHAVRDRMREAGHDVIEKSTFDFNLDDVEKIIKGYDVVYHIPQRLLQQELFGEIKKQEITNADSITISDETTNPTVPAPKDVSKIGRGKNKKAGSDGNDPEYSTDEPEHQDNHATGTADAAAI